MESEGEPEVGPKGSQMKVETKVEYARRLERDWVDRHEQLTQEFFNLNTVSADPNPLL